MTEKTTKNLESIEYDFEYFYRFHTNITTEGYKNHWHNAVEIIMPIINTYQAIINETTYNLNEYDILIIPSAESHELFAPPGTGQRIVLQFNVAGLNTIRGISDAFYIYSKHQVITPDNMPEMHDTVKALLLNMLDEHMSQNPYYEVSIANKIIERVFQNIRNDHIIH